MEYREFMSLTTEEVKQIVTDIFSPKKISCIKYHKREGYISCKIYTEWESTDENGKKDVLTSDDTIELRNPFENGADAIWADFSLSYEDYKKFRQFCFSKGIIPWLKDNPYLPMAHWEYHLDHDYEYSELKHLHEYVYCTNCGHKEGDLAHRNYCPECGFKMSIT